MSQSACQFFVIKLAEVIFYSFGVLRKSVSISSTSRGAVFQSIERATPNWVGVIVSIL